MNWGGGGGGVVMSDNINSVIYIDRNLCTVICNKYIYYWGEPERTPH